MDCTQIFKNSVKAGSTLNLLDQDKVNKVLLKVASFAVSETEYIINENVKDLKLMDQSDPRYDRLLLNPQRLESIASDIRIVASLPYPLGKVLSTSIRPDGLKISKKTFHSVLWELFMNRVPMLLSMSLLSVLNRGTPAF